METVFQLKDAKYPEENDVTPEHSPFPQQAANERRAPMKRGDLKKA